MAPISWPRSTPARSREDRRSASPHRSSSTRRRRPRSGPAATSPPGTSARSRTAATAPYDRLGPTPLGLVVGVPASPLASYLALVDPVNRIAVRQLPSAWVFPSVDLTVHLHRPPRGPWTGLDTTVTVGGAGAGGSRPRAGGRGEGGGGSRGAREVGGAA
ncbi:hypothetical protein ACFVZP_03220, partial [Streptomyces bottropensis]